MTRGDRQRGRAILLALAAAAVAHAQLTAQQERGRQIYETGASPFGHAITAVLGNNGAALPSSAIACATCHGREGQGLPEGGSKPSNLTWAELTKPWTASDPGARQHPPYTEAKLVRAIAMGFDPAGNELQPVMPRFQMSMEDMSSLVAYLRVLGSTDDPGVTATSIRIGAIIPAHGQAVIAALDAYVADLNQAGGIYGRRVDLAVVECPASGCMPAMRDSFARQPVFAFVVGYVGGAQGELAEFAARNEIPMIGALPPDPPPSGAPNRYAFYVLPGVAEQARALAAYAARTLGASGTRVVVITSGGTTQPEAAAVLDECRFHGCGAVTEPAIDRTHFDPRALVGDFKRAGVHAVFLLAPADLDAQLYAEAERQSWTADFFLPASLAADVLRAKQTASGGLFFAYPVSPSAESSDAREEYGRFALAHALPADHVAAQWTALTQARVLTEGLRRAGRDVSRDKLVNMLESLSNFPVGLTHAITWGPYRRVGATGAYIVAAGANGFVVNGWVDAETEPLHPDGGN